MAVSGTNIPANAHIVTIPNSTSFTITSAATGGATSTLTFRTGITSAKIEDDAVTYAKLQNLGTANRVLGSSSTGVIGEVQIAENMIATDAVTSAKIVAGAVGASQLENSVTGVKPHIQPGTLYPAVAGKLLDGSTSHGSTYGVAQSDGRMYYYTDIKGSKPIKDPRIGAHFGSQRHKTKSLQLLEQETATHGDTVYSIDGREWMRFCGDDIIEFNSSYGQSFYFNANGTDTDFIEITGYLSDLNYLLYTGSGRTIRYTLDGATEVGTDFGNATVTTPLVSRYVDAASLVNLGIGATLGIHTVKLRSNDTNIPFYGIELIAQDTTSTATKSQIQIPSQNVVSYGKKFTVSGTPHYDPFNGFTSGSSVTAYVDTATSLGVEGWKNSSTYYRPYNGGRVVKWVDSSGTIKTSVNMMPPNAQNVGGTAISAKANASVANDTYLPTFSGAIDHSQAEVAKTFHWREFGNGSANGNATYKDLSTNDNGSSFNASTTNAFVMDDGLTSMSGTINSSVSSAYDAYATTNNDSIYVTFIGTGFGYYDENDEIREVLVQNLPYGTHVFKHKRLASIEDSPCTIDGVSIKTEWLRFKEFDFFQPKMPPIPEDAVVLADYMLMADYVKGTAGGEEKISKGLRLISTSRDCFHDTSDSFPANAAGPSGDNEPFGLAGIHTAGNPTAGNIQCKLPAFGTHLEIRSHDNKGDIFVDGSDVAGTSSGSGYFGLITQDTASTLGSHVFESKNHSTSNLNISAMGIVTPIHTSSHYQTFETPFLHELVGGDRNMEQTNLVVTPDGKTWDEVTRDVGYIGDMALQLSADIGEVDTADEVKLDECRGFQTDANKAVNLGNKDFAIAYDRQICLRDGEYEFHYGSIIQQANSQQEMSFRVNGNYVSKGYTNDTLWSHAHISGVVQLKRGDYVQIYGGYWSNTDLGHTEYYIRRLS
jgi:hypothetical protein